jgi:hypothetical protein
MSTQERPNRHLSRRVLKESLDRATLRVTLASTAVAVLAAAAAFWSSYEAHEARMDDERPFINIDFNFPGNGIVPSILDNHILAEGKSPARNIRVMCLTAVDTAPPLMWSANGIQTDTFPFLLPNHWVKPQCSVTPGYNPPVNATIIDMGVVEYEDSRSKRYRTPFCYTWALAPDRPLDVHQCGMARGLPDVK